MKKENFEGNGINVLAMPTTMVTWNGVVEGTMIYVAEKGDNFKIGGLNGIWVMDLGKTQNAEAFMQGIKYVSQYASDKDRRICWKQLKNMATKANKTSDRYCQLIAFFCDLGLWKEKELCQPSVWDKDFSKYLANNIWNYYIG